MGVERAVTRWYLLRQRIVNEIALLETQLEQAQRKGQETKLLQAELGVQLAHAQEKLHTLGPCPKPMMG